MNNEFRDDDHGVGYGVFVSGFLMGVLYALIGLGYWWFL